MKKVTKKQFERKVNKYTDIILRKADTGFDYYISNENDDGSIDFECPVGNGGKAKLTFPAQYDEDKDVFVINNREYSMIGQTDISFSRKVY